MDISCWNERPAKLYEACKSSEVPLQFSPGHLGFGQRARRFLHPTLSTGTDGYGPVSMDRERFLHPEETSLQDPRALPF